MNDELLQILDNALNFSIWCFLFVFIILLLFARSRLRARRKKIEEFYGYESDQDPASFSDQSPWFNQWKTSFNTTLVALCAGIAGFLLYLFLPFPYFENFSAGSDWKVVPLRVTSISYDRFYEGFSLVGEVWNQTEEDSLEIRAVIKVVGTDNKPLDELEVEIDPSPLNPREAGTFECEYTEYSPFIKGYQIEFFSVDGTKISHVTGFDVE